VAGCSGITGGSTPSAPSAPSADSAGGGGDGACGSESGFCITVDITGATTVQGTAQTLNLKTCADYARGESPGGALQLPGLLGEEIGGREISAANEIREYAGPGTYDKDTLKSVAGVIDISIDNTPYEVPRASRTGDPLGSFSEKVRARASESTEVLPGVQR
jgi:hypothetical protein